MRKSGFVSLMGVALTFSVWGGVAVADGGYLLITATDYKAEGKPHLSYKINLSNEFLSQFKNAPVPQKSMGSLFTCSLSGGATMLTQWFSPWSNNGKKVSTWFWVGHGGAQTTIKFPGWDTIDTEEQVSNGTINTVFKFQYVEANDSGLEGALDAPVKLSDETVLVQGQAQTTFPISCSFQEG